MQHTNHVDNLKASIENLSKTLKHSIDNNKQFSETVLYSELMNACIEYVERHRSELINEIKYQLPLDLADELSIKQLQTLTDTLESYKPPLSNYTGSLDRNVE
jgi:hypothetical protein